MAGCAGSSAPGPGYNSGPPPMLSNVSGDLSALQRRKTIAAKLGLPPHILSTRPFRQGGHRQRRAAMLAGVLNKYHPQLRAEATSAAVCASNALQADEQQHWFSSTNRTTPWQTTDKGPAAGFGKTSSSRHLGEKHSSFPQSSPAELLDGFAYEPEFSWMTLVSSTMPRFYRLLQADSIPVLETDYSTGCIGGQSDRVGSRYTTGVQSSDCAEDLRGVFDKIIQHLTRHPAGDIAKRLVNSRTNSLSQTAANRPFVLQTIYTGVADTKCTGYDTLPGRAAVMIGLHGTLAIEQRAKKGQSSAETKQMERRANSERPWHAAREAHLRSAMLLADAVLQRHSAGTLTFPELRCLVTMITRIQRVVVLDLAGAANTAHAAAISSLELLVALARTLAAWPILPSMDFEKFQSDMSLLLILQHESGVLAAMKAAKDLHVVQPARFVELYLRGFAAYGQTRVDRPLSPQRGSPQGPALRTSSKGEEDVCHVKEKIEDTWKYATFLRLGLEQMTDLLFLRQHAAAGGRGVPLRLSGLVPPEDARGELVRMLLAVGLDASRHSLVAVGGEAMKLVLANVAALGYVRSESAKIALALSGAAIAAAGTMAKARGSIQQQILDGAVSIGSTTALSQDATDDGSVEDRKCSTSCGSTSSISSMNSSSAWDSFTSSSSGRDCYVEAGSTFSGEPSPCVAMTEGILAVRLMTSAQLVTQHCPEVTIAVERAPRTPTGPMDACDVSSGGQSINSAGGLQRRQQLLDPYCMPEDVPFVVAVTLLPLSAALTQHISRLSALEDAQHICEPMPVDGWNDVHNWQVKRLSDSMRKRHVASMVAFTERGVERMVVLAAKISAELLREGIDVVVVPELYMPCMHDLKQIMESMKWFIADYEQHRTNGGRYELNDGHQDKPRQPNSASTGPFGDSDTQPEAANLPPAHNDSRRSLLSKQDPRERLRPDWQLQRRLALNGIASALLNLRGSSISYAQFLQRELLERYARLDESGKGLGMAASATEGCAHSTTCSIGWDHIRSAAERQGRWLCDRVGMVRLKLTLVAFEVGHGGELGRALPSLRTC